VTDLLTTAIDTFVNRILVTDSDITDKVRTIFARNSSSSGGQSACHTKSMFLLVPNTNVPTKEFNKYFEHEIATYAGNSVHPLISQFSKQYLSPDPVSNKSSDSLEFGARNPSGSSSQNVKRKKLIITSSEGLSLSMKAVWTMAMALKKMEDDHCVPGNLSKVECIETLKGLGMREMILNQTRDFNYDKLPGLGVASMVILVCDLQNYFLLSCSLLLNGELIRHVLVVVSLNSGGIPIEIQCTKHP
jgi:hypothetical protein